jgi:predicted DCC family thiol-disulfide oxidoreductase YuxK
MGSNSSIERTILFDGVCNLCNGSVLFVIKRDTHSVFHFAALQSDFGKKQLNKLGVSQSDFDTVLLLKQGRVYKKSNAALEIAKDLSGLWPMLYMFKIVPTFIRDAVYTFIANNRYQWFGRKESCMIPTPELRARFAD